MTKIAFFDTKSYDRDVFEKKNKEYGFELHFFEERLTPATTALARDMDVVCCFVNDECNAAVVADLVQYGVKMIALRCAGFNNVALDAARDKLMVANVPAYSPNAVAEYTVTLMLSLNRKVYRSVNRTREGNFKLSGLQGFDMKGKTVGIIGLGRIAKELVKILKGFGMNLLAYDIYPDHDFAQQYGVKMVELDELYENSDIITLHCPLTEDNKYMINAEAILKMKYGVMIINTGRGKLIRTEDLIDGLRSHQVGSAGLDVYEEEQNYFYEDRSDKMIDDDKLALLLMMPNVIVTSHQAFFTQEATQNIAETTLQNVRDFFDGKEVKNQVKAK